VLVFPAATPLAIGTVDMQRLSLIPFDLSLVLGGAPVLAAPPPSNAQPLSQIVQPLEQRLNPAYFDEIEWDEDGYWEVEYVDRNGAKNQG
jgi:hypothetical protein